MNYSRAGIRSRQLKLNDRGPKWGKKLVLILIVAVFVGVIGVTILGVSAGIGVFRGILDSAPDISTIDVTPRGQSSFVYDIKGNQIAKLVSANANRVPVSYDKIPKNLEHAFVAIEDERFYEHNGIDIKGIIRAGYKVIQHGNMTQGASTITQQLLKNNVFVGWTEESNNIERIKRKVQEQYLAVQVEKGMSKEDIMINYLNTINLGQNTLGVQAASKRYFGKDVSELNLSECAVIASITQNPSRFNPIVHPDYSRERRDLVLQQMLKLDYITDAEYKAAIADNVYERISNHNLESGSTTTTSYFVDALIDQLEDDLAAAGYNDSQIYTMLYSSGYKIYSTQDPDIQAICDEEFRNEENYPANTKWYLKYNLTVRKADGSLENHSPEMFKAYFKKEKAGFNNLFADEESANNAILEYQDAVMEEGDEVYAEDVDLTPQPQASFTVEDQKTGHIVAMVGGRGTKDQSRVLNRATMSKRQPGSCFKVLSAFAPAMDSKGFTLATTIDDAPFNYYDGTKVSNWYGGDTYYGLSTIRKGIWWSMNVVAVKTITQITPQLGYEYLKNFGISTIVESRVVGDGIYSDIGQPLALGGITDGVLNVELNSAYAAIANGGVYVEPKLYTKVLDSEGNVVLDNTTTTVHRVISEETAWLLTDAMKDCVKIGTGTRANFKGMSIAGKTGTTTSGVDVWFAGYTPYYTATCWAGYDNNTSMTDAEQRVAANMFKAIMSRVHENLEDIGFPKPETIHKVTICSKSGKLPVEGLCDGCLAEEYFSEDTIPTETCNVHYLGNLCAYDMLPATEQCPFCYMGTAELSPVEDESLWSGSASLDGALDPLAIGDTRVTTGTCHHTEEFYMDPNWEALQAAETAELMRRFQAGETPNVLGWLP